MCIDFMFSVHSFFTINLYNSWKLQILFPQLTVSCETCTSYQNSLFL